MAVYLLLCDTVSLSGPIVCGGGRGVAYDELCEYI